MKRKRQKVYAFIDSQNLNLGLLNDIKNKKGKTIYKGWKLDFKKFRVYLSDKFRVSKAFYLLATLKKINIYTAVLSAMVMSWFLNQPPKTVPAS